LSIAFPQLLNASRRRRPAYISAATAHAALFIDGAATAAASGACAPPGCSLSWSIATAVPASHIFAVEIDTGPAGMPPNTVLAENSASYVIVAGNNSLSALTLDGVAATATISGETCSGSDCTGTLTIGDAAGNPITSPGSTFDNASVAVSSSNPSNGIVATPAGGSIATVSATGTYAYDFKCVNATDTFTINVTSGSPSNDVTAAELASLTPAVTYPSSTIPLTQDSSIYICRTGTTIAKAFFLTSSGTFSVPADWNNANNSIEVIGGGGGGYGGAGVGGGGGGGGYAIVTNAAIAGTVKYNVGAGGTGGSAGTGTNGGDTWFCSATTLCGGVGAPNVIVAARGGKRGTARAGGAGGTVAVGTGFTGGGGGTNCCAVSSTAGGGAAGPLGAGGNGGRDGTTGAISPGGGGNGGGSAGQGGSGIGSPAGQGGNNASGAGGGAAPGGAGTNGGGGGGGSASAGGTGGNGTEWSASFGSGGGGGAGNGGAGGPGGAYGGGGGGGDAGASGGNGGAGLIVVIYTP
jgi:hypothetical protein